MGGVEREDRGTREGLISLEASRPSGQPFLRCFKCKSSQDGSFRHESVTDFSSILAPRMLSSRPLMSAPAQAPKTTSSSTVVRERIIVPVPPDYSLLSLPENKFKDTEVAGSATPLIFRSGRELVLENGAVLPSGSCVKCGRPSAFVLSCGLRDRRQPRTWFGSRPRMMTGLCRKHREDHAIAVALTWSMLGVSVVLLVSGVLTANIVTLVLAVIVSACSGFFRAGSPFSVPIAEENKVVICGAGEVYLRKLPVQPDSVRGEANL